MHARTLAAAALVALAAAVFLAVPALAGPATGQVNVRETDSTCRLTFATVGSQKRLILFHIINNGTQPHGIIVWGVKSTMALPKGEANLFVKFRTGGKYNYACTAGAYKHPKITHRGVFQIKS